METNEMLIMNLQLMREENIKDKNIEKILVLDEAIQLIQTIK